MHYIQSASMRCIRFPHTQQPDFFLFPLPCKVPDHFVHTHHESRPVHVQQDSSLCLWSAFSASVAGGWCEYAEQGIYNMLQLCLILYPVQIYAELLPTDSSGNIIRAQHILYFMPKLKACCSYLFREGIVKAVSIP